MADPAALEGRTFGPRRLVPTAASTRAFVAAVSDDPSRWREAAPPGWAGAVLFAVAGDLIADPVVSGGGGIVHADQTFEWHAPFAHDVPLDVLGRVDRVRRRGEAAWVSFTLQASGHDGPVLDAGSTFVITGPAAPSTHDDSVPGVGDRGPHDGAPAGDHMARSASRADLVAYAAASGDLNPIHWDHRSALAAGLPGVVCHGLLLAAWCAHLAVHDLPGAAPLASARIRFRRPVPAATPCTLDRVVDGTSRTVALSAGGADAMTFAAVTR